MIKYLLGFSLIASTVLSYAAPRNDANFAFGGATTNTQNATAFFAPELDGAARAVGLELVGLTQQMDFAEAVLKDVDSSRDVFWLWAGTNNILTGSITGAPDPTLAPNELKAAMVRLYKNVGARNFVIPNLMLLGNIPQFNQEPATQEGINNLTVAQNALLAQTIAEFSAEYPAANVISLNVQNLFLELAASGQFSNTTEACFTTGLPNGIMCSEYLYADDIHFSSAAAEKIAELAIAQLSYINVRRFISLGDSFLDTGSFYNTTLRSIGMGIPAAPSYQGRFSDGLNVIDHLESKLMPEVLSRAFAQPKRTKIVKGSNDLGVESQVVVPVNIAITNESRFGLVWITFGDQGYCWYFPDGKPDGQRRLTGCRGGVKGGKNVTTQTVRLIAPFTRGEVSMDLFSY